MLCENLRDRQQQTHSLQEETSGYQREGGEVGGWGGTDKGIEGHYD